MRLETSGVDDGGLPVEVTRAGASAAIGPVPSGELATPTPEVVTIVY